MDSCSYRWCILTFSALQTRYHESTRLAVTQPLLRIAGVGLVVLNTHIIYFNSHCIRRKHPPTPETAAHIVEHPCIVYRGVWMESARPGFSYQRAIRPDHRREESVTGQGGIPKDSDAELRAALNSLRLVLHYCTTQ